MLWRRLTNVNKSMLAGLIVCIFISEVRLQITPPPVSIQFFFVFYHFAKFCENSSATFLKEILPTERWREWTNEQMNSEDQQSCRSYWKHSRAACIHCTWPWDNAGCRGHHEHVCLLSSMQVLRHCNRSVVCGIRYHVPYWPWFKHWWSVRSTTVIQC